MGTVQSNSIIKTVEHDIVTFIERQQELMFNERDFQMQLAVCLRQSGHYDDVDVEYYIPNSAAVKAGYEWSSELRLDIVVRCGGVYAVVELKYPTRRVITDIKRFGRTLPKVEIVKNHGAQDIVSYNIWKDVRRIEIIRNLFPEPAAHAPARYATPSPQPMAAAMFTGGSTGPAPPPQARDFPPSTSMATTASSGTTQ